MRPVFVVYLAALGNGVTMPMVLPSGSVSQANLRPSGSGFRLCDDDTLRTQPAGVLTQTLGQRFEEGLRILRLGLAHR